MRKSLKRTLDRLRASANGMFRKRASMRGGSQEPQRMQACPAAVRARS